MESRELRLTPKAQSDLQDIWLYGAETWSPAQADIYLEALGQRFDALCSMPTMAREYAEFTPPVRIHPSGPHVTIYVFDEVHLDVIRVLGGRQNWRAILEAIET